LYIFVVDKEFRSQGRVNLHDYPFTGGGNHKKEFLMKRNKIIAVALVVMMMVGAVVLMSCGGCPGEGNCSIDWDNFTGAWSYCGEKVTDQGDAETALECKVYKDAQKIATGSLPTGKSECDC
jgi:hypothetical protein